MSISSTGIYGTNSTIVTSDLYEDVEQLKSNLTILTTSHLSVTSNHDGRLDTLESDNTSNIIRIGDLEIDVYVYVCVCVCVCVCMCVCM